MTSRPPPFLGHDGAITLAAAAALAMATGGIAPLLSTRAVLATARRAGVAPPAAPARILVLGHRLRRGMPSADFEARLRRALDLARRHPGARVRILGGRATAGAPSEAEAGRDWLVAHGLDAARIELETQSRHTLENLRNHRDFGVSPGPEALVTSRFHLHRAMLMAQGLGLSLAAVAAEDTLAPNVLYLLAEGFRVHWYLTGRGMARLLDRRRWLARIG